MNAHKNKIIIGLAIIDVICISGCASDPQTGHTSNQTWYQAGTSAEQVKRDLAGCQNEALVYGRSYSPIASSDPGASIALGVLAAGSEANREKQIIKTCMEAKGYSLVSINSPLFTDSETPHLSIKQVPTENETHFNNLDNSNQTQLTPVTSALRKHSAKGLYISPVIPAKKSSNACRSCTIPKEQELLAIIDSTVFGSADDCLAITSGGIYIKNKSIDSHNPGVSFLSNTEFMSAPLEKNGLYYITIGGDRVHFSGPVHELVLGQG